VRDCVGYLGRSERIRCVLLGITVVGRENIGEKVELSVVGCVTYRMDTRVSKSKGICFDRPHM